jgi:hypothetical protein
MHMNGMLSNTIYREPTHLLKIAQSYNVKHMLLLSQYKLKTTIIPKRTAEQWNI